MATTSVDVRDSGFEPSHIAVAAGSTVTWTDSDGYPHNVVFDGGGGESRLIDGVGTYEQTFPTAGTFDYRCTLHSGMVGQVTVAAS